MRLISIAVNKDARSSITGNCGRVTHNYVFVSRRLSATAVNSIPFGSLKYNRLSAPMSHETIKYLVRTHIAQLRHALWTVHPGRIVQPYAAAIQQHPVRPIRRIVQPTDQLLTLRTAPKTFGVKSKWFCSIPPRRVCHFVTNGVISTPLSLRVWYSPASSPMITRCSRPRARL